MVEHVPIPNYKIIEIKMTKATLNLANVRGILSDIDGTLVFKNKPISGAIDAVNELRKRNIKLIFFTNTDSKTPITIYKKLVDLGFSIKLEEIFTPIIALKEYLFHQPEVKIHLVTTEEVAREFDDFCKVDVSEIPDIVILGDFRDNWDVHRLNLAFKFVLKGAKLFGTQGNKYFLDSKGEPVIDTGSFVNMVASAASQSALIFGKPSREYFQQALNRLGVGKDESIVIGDDLYSDIHGANEFGIRSILVKTGKGQYYNSSETNIEPYSVIESFSSLLEFMNSR